MACPMSSYSWSGKRPRMMNKVKVVSYNKELHALHFHFFAKNDAIAWEDIQIPFRGTTLNLQNPDAKYREI